MEVVMMGMIYLMLWMVNKLVEVLITILGAAGVTVTIALLLLHNKKIRRKR